MSTKESIETLKSFLKPGGKFTKRDARKLLAVLEAEESVKETVMEMLRRPAPIYIQPAPVLPAAPYFVPQTQPLFPDYSVPTITCSTEKVQ